MIAGCTVLLTMFVMGERAWDITDVPIEPAMIEHVEPVNKRMDWIGPARARIVLRQLDSTVRPRPMLVRQSPSEIRRLPCRRFEGE